MGDILQRDIRSLNGAGDNAERGKDGSAILEVVKAEERKPLLNPTKHIT